MAENVEKMRQRMGGRHEAKAGHVPGQILHLALGLGRSDWTLASATHGCPTMAHHSSATSLIPIGSAQNMQHPPQSYKRRQRLREAVWLDGHNQERTQAGVCPAVATTGSKPLSITF